MQDIAGADTALGTDASGGSAPYKFIALWVASFVLPCVLLTIALVAIFHFAPADFPYSIALYLPIPTWLVVAYGQFRFLRPQLRRSRWWLIVTAVGGVLGTFVCGWARFQILGELEQYAYEGIMISDYDRMVSSDWILSAAPAVSVIVGSLLGATILGALQSLCFEKLSSGLLWLFLSAASGVIAGAIGSGSYWAYIWTLFRIHEAITLRAFFADAPFTTATGVLVAMVTYGALTGVILWRLLAAGARRHNAMMVNQFD